MAVVTLQVFEWRYSNFRFCNFWRFDDENARRNGTKLLALLEHADFRSFPLREVLHGLVCSMKRCLNGSPLRFFQQRMNIKRTHALKLLHVFEKWENLWMKNVYQFRKLKKTSTFELFLLACVAPLVHHLGTLKSVHCDALCTFLQRTSPFSCNKRTKNCQFARKTQPKQ